MSDKTKMLADKAAIRARLIKWYQWRKEHPPFVPRCACGETKDVWAVSLKRETTFYCEKHLPDDYK